MVREKGMIDSTMVTSFELQHLTRVRRLAPRITLGWLKSAPDDPTPGLDLGRTAILVDEGAIRQNAAKMDAYDALLASRKSLLGAFTIRYQSTMPALNAAGVRWFIADAPLDRGSLPAP
jgi:hypothetical protein